MIKNLLVLPNQLFSQIKKMQVENIIIYEAPEYFTKYNYNQKKIAAASGFNAEFSAGASRE